MAKRTAKKPKLTETEAGMTRALQILGEIWPNPRSPAPRAAIFLLFMISLHLWDDGRSFKPTKKKVARKKPRG